jgi:hypothetical protein
MEHKIELMRRLQLAGQWEAASAFKEECRHRLRAEKIPRGEANERAWDEMRRRYLPLGSQQEQPIPPPNVASVDTEDEPAQPPLESLRSKLTGPITLDRVAEWEWALDNSCNWTVGPSDAPTFGAWAMLQQMRFGCWKDSETGTEAENVVVEGLVELMRSAAPADRVRGEVRGLLQELLWRYGIDLPQEVGTAIEAALLMHVVPGCPTSV